jgi:hypothetical protein
MTRSLSAEARQQRIGIYWSRAARVILKMDMRGATGRISCVSYRCDLLPHPYGAATHLVVLVVHVPVRVAIALGTETAGEGERRLGARGGETGMGSSSR